MIKNLPFKTLQARVPWAVFLLTLVVLVPFALSRPVQYEAHARIWIHANTKSSPDQTQVSGGLYAPSTFFFNSPIQTASEIIRSGEVIKQSIRLLKQRQKYGPFPTEGDVLAGIVVEPIKDTDIVSIRYKASKPEQSARVLQAILDSCIDISRTQNTSSATAQRAFLEQQLSKATARLAQISAERTTYQKVHSISDFDEDARRLLDQVTSTDQLIKDEDSQIIQKHQLIQSLEAKVQAQPSSCSLEVEKAVENKLSETQMQLLQAEQKFKENHPVRLRLEKDKEKLMAELQTMRSNEAGEWRPLKEQIEKEKLELLALEQSRRDHCAELQVLEAKRIQLPGEAKAWSELERQKELAINSVAELEHQAHLAQLQEIVAQGQTNIKVIDNPVTPMRPQGPSRTVLLVACTAFAGFLALGAHFLVASLNPFIVKPRQAQAILPLPVLGALPSQETPDPARMDRIRRNAGKLLRGRKRILITSASPGEGKTTLAIALAQSFAQAGYNTCLVDVNQANPDLYRAFALRPCTDFGENSARSDMEKTVSVVSNGLSIVRCGEPSAPVNLLERRRVAKFLTELEAAYDILILDGSSAESSARYLAAVESPTLIVVLSRMHETLKRSLRLLCSHLRDADTSDAAYVFVDTDEIEIMNHHNLASSTERTAETEESSVW